MKKFFLLLIFVVSCFRVEGIATVTLLRHPETQKKVLLLGALYERRDTPNYDSLTEFNRRMIDGFKDALFDPDRQEKSPVDVIFTSEEFSSEQLEKITKEDSTKKLAVTFEQLMKIKIELNNECLPGFDEIQLWQYEPRGDECDYVICFMRAFSQLASREFTVEEGNSFIEWFEGQMKKMDGLITVKEYLRRIKEYLTHILTSIINLRKNFPAFGNSTEYTFVNRRLSVLNKSIRELETLFKQYNSDLSISIYRGLMNVVKDSSDDDMVMIGNLYTQMMDNCNMFFADTAYLLKILGSQMEKGRTILITETDHTKSVSSFLKTFGYKIENRWSIISGEFEGGMSEVRLCLPSAQTEMLAGLDALYQ